MGGSVGASGQGDEGRVFQSRCGHVTAQGQPHLKPVEVGQVKVDEVQPKGVSKSSLQAFNPCLTPLHLVVTQLSQHPQIEGGVGLVVLHKQERRFPNRQHGEIPFPIERRMKIVKGRSPKFSDFLGPFLEIRGEVGG